MVWSEMLYGWCQVVLIGIGFSLLILIMFKFISPLSNYIINKEIFVLEDEYKRLIDENVNLCKALKEKE